MRKTAAARFCGDCGYKFTRDSSGDCPMCARFEQLRTELAVPRRSERAGRHRRPEEPPDVNHPVAPIDRRATASEYGVVFAAHRARAASAGGRKGATAIRTPALPQPANAIVEVPKGTLARDSPAPPKKKSTARRNRPTPTPPRPPPTGGEPTATVIRTPALPQPANATEATRAGELPGPSNKKSTARRNRPTPPPGGGPTPILIRLRAPQPTNATMEALIATLADESPAPLEASLGRGNRPTRSPIRERAPHVSAATTEGTALPAPDAHRVMYARASRHHAASSREGYPWQTALWVAVAGALIGASVPLLSSLIR